MTAPTSQLTLAVFADNGDRLRTETVSGDAIDQALLDVFTTRLKWLSGDLDLPLEGTVAGKDELTYRITSDGRNAYVFYYQQNQIVHLSLMLLGGDSDAEQEMVDSVRLLMLDETDDDDLDEDAAAELLTSSKFDFLSVTDRPVACSISLGSAEEEQSSHSAGWFYRAETHLAWAFSNRAAVASDAEPSRE